MRYDDKGVFVEHIYYCKESRNEFRLAMYTESLFSLSNLISMDSNNLVVGISLFEPGKKIVSN